MHAVALPRMPLVTSCIPIGFAAKAVVSARTDVATGPGAGTGATTGTTGPGPGPGAAGTKILRRRRGRR